MGTGAAVFLAVIQPATGMPVLSPSARSTEYLDRGFALFECAAGFAHQLFVEDGHTKCGCAWLQVELIHVDPEGVRRNRRLYVIDEGIRIDDRAIPSGVGAGYARVRAAKRHRHVVDEAHHVSDGLRNVTCLWQVFERVGGAHEPVCRLDAAGQLGDGAAEGLVLEQIGDLLVVGGLVCHHLVMPAHVNRRLALDELNNRRVPGGVGNRDVQRQAFGVFLAEGSVDHLHLVEVADHLIHGGVVVEVVLRPLEEGDAGARGVARLVLGAVEEEQIYNEALLVDAFLGANVETGDNDAGIARRPFGRVFGHAPLALHSGGEGPQDLIEIAAPIERAANELYRIVVPEDAAASLSGGGGERGCGTKPGEGGECLPTGNAIAHWEESPSEGGQSSKERLERRFEQS
ncbi:protein of unknown function [Hyphomicrobium sp. 1Nfss2.1]